MLIRRFNAYHRILHIVMAVSFMGLVLSGMPLKYSHAPWAAWMMRVLGGFHNAGLIHRTCGAITLGYFAAHLLYLFYDFVKVRKLNFDFFGSESMVPRLKDIQDMIGNIKRFLGTGPVPQFDKYTYWEKFDYWAVFWGMGMIGVSGLLLWFPEFFGRFVPGWVFNVTTIIHSDEALLAAGFIFTIHFFNTHMRPEKFPMDPVIFTGSVSLEELKRERPLEYRRLVEEGLLERNQVSPPPFWVLPLGMLFGFIIMALGFFLLVLIVLGQFVYS